MATENNTSHMASVPTGEPAATVSASGAASATTPAGIFSGFTKLTPLDLNNIRLDVRHTILTPTYLESISSGRENP